MIPTGNHRRAGRGERVPGKLVSPPHGRPLAALLAEQGRSVLVVDGDAQPQPPRWFGVNVADQPTIGDLLMKRASLEAVVTDTNTAGVRIDAGLRELDADVIADLTNCRRASALKTALDGHAGVILIDTPGDQRAGYNLKSVVAITW